jgi:hypothetical protein
MGHPEERDRFFYSARSRRASAATAPGGAYRLAAGVSVPFLEPPAALQGETGLGDELLYRAVALGAFACGIIGKFLAQFKPVAALTALVFVDWHTVGVSWVLNGLWCSSI